VAGILGKYLLLCGLKKLGFSSTHIESLEYKKNNRPHLSSLPHLDFNISHSGSLVVCALSTNVRLGIDVEKQKPVNILNLKEQFSPGQWEELENASDPVKLFYQYWVQKESVVKAVDSEYLIPFAEIDIQPNRATINNKVWYLTSLNIEPSYCSWLTTDCLADIVMEQVFV
jgi:4'-phosphopantetheinyl transferase